jgi:hypothetical protein
MTTWLLPLTVPEHPGPISVLSEPGRLTPLELVRLIDQAEEERLGAGLRFR